MTLWSNLQTISKTIMFSFSLHNINLYFCSTRNECEKLKTALHHQTRGQGNDSIRLYLYVVENFIFAYFCILSPSPPL
jgi:hypothetical protein